MVVYIKLNTSCSFRSIEKSLYIINLYLNLNTKTPSHVTISNWIKKIGCYQLLKQTEKATDWIIIIDESIQLGSEKLLVILAVRSSSLKSKTNPLKYKDVEVITLKSKQGWNSETISIEIKIAESKLGKILYAVSDRGSSITKALFLCNIRQIHDISHRTSNILKKIYNIDIEFNEFTKSLATLRQQVQQSKIAYILPPQQRAKCRFMNLKPLSEWSLKAIKLLEQETTTNEIINKLQWLKNKEAFILEMQDIMKVVEEIFVLTKSKGLNTNTIKQCRKYLNSLKTQKGKTFKQLLNVYFDEVIELRLDEKKILCSSDIIESLFGKYKMIAGLNSMNGITDISLSIPALTSNIDIDEIKKIMETINMKSLHEWSCENIGDSLLKQRCGVFNLKNRVRNKIIKAA
jgi:hypothetical protein